MWLEMMRALAEAKVERTVHFVASTGHELGHYGLEDYLEKRHELISSAVAWVHLGACGGEVNVHGRVTNSGDLIHADRHGAVIIPHGVARQVPAAAELCMRREKPILDACKSGDFSVELIEKALKEAGEIH